MPPRHLLTLPTELVERILTFVLEDPIPFRIPDIEAVYAKSQVAHQRDWEMVNATCQRIRTIGKPLFWAHKTLFLHINDFQAFNRRSAPWISKEDQETALSTVRAIIVEVRPHCSHFIRLRNIMRHLPSATRIGISIEHPCGPGMADDAQMKEAAVWRPMPTKLHNALRAARFDFIDQVELAFYDLHEQPGPNWLDAVIAALVTTCAGFYGAVEARRLAQTQSN